MEYMIIIVRKENDKLIKLKELKVNGKVKSVSWDNMTYPVNTGLTSYIDMDKKLGYIFFEQDNINELVMLNEIEAKTIKDIPISNLGDIDKTKLESNQKEDKKKIPVRLYNFAKLALTASELDMFINQNVIASIFSRLKNFSAGTMNKSTILIIILVGALFAVGGGVVGSHFAGTTTVIRYLNSTQTNIPSV
jgi:hypothetical protein